MKANGCLVYLCPVNNIGFKNEEIVSPAHGKVIKILDRIKDNISGKMNTKKPTRNYVIIEHTKKEYREVKSANMFYVN